ncbi:YegP family protein [Arthrobacter sp. AD-310]
MAGSFEVFVDADSLYRFRLLAPDGMVMAVSQGFADKRAVAAGIAAVRECAGTGLVTDLCPAGAVARPVPAAAPAPLPADTQPDCGHRAAARAHTFTLAKGPRRPALSPRWTRALAP